MHPSHHNLTGSFAESEQKAHVYSMGPETMSDSKVAFTHSGYIRAALVNDCAGLLYDRRNSLSESDKHWQERAPMTLITGFDCTNPVKSDMHSNPVIMSFKLFFASKYTTERHMSKLMSPPHR